MKILVFGASGKIGSKVVENLISDHEIVKVGSRTGDIIADYTNPEAVLNVFHQTGKVDAIVVSVGGDSQFKPFESLTDDDFRYGAERKLVAQFRIVELAKEYLNEGGSITLTSGFLTHYPNPYSLATGPFNAAIDTYVEQAAPLMPNNIKLNVVSPAPVVEPERVGEGLVSAEQVAEYFVQAITGNASGKVLRAWGGLPIPQTN